MQNHLSRFVDDGLLRLLQRCSDGIAIVASNPWRVMFANQALAGWLGVNVDDLKDVPLDVALGSAWQETRLKEHLDAVAAKAVAETELLLHLPRDPASIARRVRIFRMETEDSPLVGMVIEAITSEATHTAYAVSRQDPLTEVPDRAFLLTRLATLFEGQRWADRDLAVLFIDLDNFKHVNDQHGHLIGDRVLREVAGRLRTCVREGDHVTRYGGDEFVVLLEHVPSMAEIEPVLERIRSALAAPITLPGGQSFTLSLSIGVAKPAPHHRSPEDLLDDADRSMYAAKRKSTAPAVTDT